MLLQNPKAYDEILKMKRQKKNCMQSFNRSKSHENFINVAKLCHTGDTCKKMKLCINVIVQLAVDF
jgi:hypothetical protein